MAKASKRVVVTAKATKRKTEEDGSMTNIQEVMATTGTMNHGHQIVGGVDGQLLDGILAIGRCGKLQSIFCWNPFKPLAQDVNCTNCSCGQPAREHFVCEVLMAITVSGLLVILFVALRASAPKER